MPLGYGTGNGIVWLGNWVVRELQLEGGEELSRECCQELVLAVVSRLGGEAYIRFQVERGIQHWNM